MTAPTLLLGPILLYLGAALLIPLLRPWLSRRAQTLAVLLASVAGFGLALLLAREEVRWSLSNWGALSSGHALVLRNDPLATAFLLLVALVGMGALVGSLDEAEEGASSNYQAGVLAVLGGLAAVALADNLLTFVLANLLVDLALVFSVGLTGRSRWFLVLSLHSRVAQALLLLAMLLLWRATGDTQFAELSGPAAWLAIAAALVRLGPLPFSLLAVPFERLPRRVDTLLPVLTLGMGGLLLGRLAVLVPTLPLVELAPVAALGVALAGWVAWQREEPSVRGVMLGAWVAGWALWAFAWGQATVAVAVAWSGTLALGALSLHGGHVERCNPRHWPAIVGALVLVGAPGGVLWATVRALSGAAWVQERAAAGGIATPAGAAWLGVVAAIGTMGATAALLDWLLVDRGEVSPPSRWPGVALLAAASLPFLGRVLGIYPPLFPDLPLPAAPWAAQLALPVLGWAGGLWLWGARDRLHSLRPVLGLVAHAFSFVWLWRIIGRGGWLLLNGLRGLVLILEGENYGWLLLFLFVVLLFLGR